MKKWTSYSGYTGLMVEPDFTAKKIIDLQPRAVIEAFGAVEGEFELVEYNGQRGWVLSAKVEPYRENFPRDCVYIADIQTADKTDAEQFVTWEGKRQVNMCGQMSICHLLGMGLSTFLTEWKRLDPVHYAAVFGTSKVARGTGQDELARMLALFGRDTARLSQRYKAYTPDLVDELRGAIVGVRMDKVTGRLNGGGVGHWVVVVNSLPERMGYGTVDVYNPYPNRVERYSYAEFRASANLPFGVWIK